MGDFRGLLVAVVIGLIIGAIGGYFIGKKFGGGWGTLGGFGITVLVVFLLAMCKPCQNGIYNVFFSEDRTTPTPSRPKNQNSE